MTCSGRSLSPPILSRVVSRVRQIAASSNFIYESPFFCAFAFNAIGIGAKNIGEIFAHAALIRDASKPPVPGRTPRKEVPAD